jgi:hypothetical protein
MKFLRMEATYIIRVVERTYKQTVNHSNGALQRVINETIEGRYKIYPLFLHFQN